MLPSASTRGTLRKRGPSLLLRAVVLLIGVGALAFLLWEPHIEGRNANATLYEVYFEDPFLVYVYAGSSPFFLGLCHAWKVLGHTGGGTGFSAQAVRSLRTIKYCAIALIGVVALGEVLILMTPSDDHAGGVAMGVAITFASVVVATAMAVLERRLHRAVHLESENDLTA